MRHHQHISGFYIFKTLVLYYVISLKSKMLHLRTLRMKSLVFQMYPVYTQENGPMTSDTGLGTAARLNDIGNTNMKEFGNHFVPRDGTLTMIKHHT